MTPRMAVALLLAAIALASCAAPQRKPWTAKTIYEAVKSAEEERESWK